MTSQKRKIRPPQTQPKPGLESKMSPPPDSDPKGAPALPKLQDKVTVISGGDSGIGKATALLFAQEGSDIVIGYLNEQEDAMKTQKQILALGRKCIRVKGDLSKERNCKRLIDITIKKFGKIDILINNAAVHWEAQSLENITTKQLQTTFATNFYSCFWLTKYTLPYLKKDASIINTTSVTAYRGSPHLMDYAASKGAILSFTRSLSSNLIRQGIRVNAVAPGPVWTPLISSSLTKKEVTAFGSDTPMGRAAEPNEIAPCFLFLAGNNASFISGQVLHPNGGEIING